MGIHIRGIGAALPARVVTREELLAQKKPAYAGMPSEFFDIPEKRRYCNREETASLLGSRACDAALQHAGLAPDEIDLLMCFSTMPDLQYPKDGQQIAMLSKLSKATAMDVDVACASFMSMLKIANAMIDQGCHSRIAIVCCANWVHRAFDKSRDYSPIGDGAAAVIVEKADKPSLIAFKEVRDDRFFDFVKMESPSVTGKSEHLEFAINDAFTEFAKSGSVHFVKEMLSEANVFPDSIDWFVPHQVGVRAMKGWSRSLELGEEKLLTTYDWTGNCMATNIPLIIDHYVKVEPRIKRGDLLLMFALASGFHGSAMLWRY